MDSLKNILFDSNLKDYKWWVRKSNNKVLDINGENIFNSDDIISIPVSTIDSSVFIKSIGDIAVKNLNKLVEKYYDNDRITSNLLHTIVDDEFIDSDIVLINGVIVDISFNKSFHIIDDLRKEYKFIDPENYCTIVSLNYY